MDLTGSFEWFFDLHGGREQGPNEASSTNFKKSPYLSLVRESIQNSLDASQNNGKPVVMDFKIQSIKKGSYQKFF